MNDGNLVPGIIMRENEGTWYTRGTRLLPFGTLSVLFARDLSTLVSFN